ncbi:Mobile element protein [hydrothermal vent metagenome]|uniref:Mobile element protein n=1 Tax=hydrothermal vent metagenome TaxID=652676 RepID=A0A3B1AGK7_9ZZZZ
MSYKHLSLEERHYIEVSLKNGNAASDIGKDLGRPQCTITREIARNTGLRGYRHSQANGMANKRHETKPKFIKLTADIIDIIEVYIRKDWSPEQIVGRLEKDNIIKLHHETIYQHILSDKRSGGDLYTHLRHQNKTYRKRYGSAHPRNRNGIPNRTDIDDRPEVVNTRERVGDWEGDTMIGKNHKGVFVTLDERKSKLRLALPVSSKKARDVTDAMLSLFGPIKHVVSTITFDNGKEFAYHEEVAKEMECETYFAKPYHSWERGQNENANGLLRQYFPKSMELIDVTTKQVLDAVHKLNSRPRKCLGFKTPYEVFEELTGINKETLNGYALMT